MRFSMYSAAAAAVAASVQAVPLDAESQYKVDRNLVGYNAKFAEAHVASANDVIPELIDAASFNLTEFGGRTLEPFIPEGAENAALKEKRFINGNDDRYLFSTVDFPWRVAGKIYWSNGIICSGSLVGPNLVLTAKHCWVSGATGRFAPSYDYGARLGSGVITEAYFVNLDNPSDGCNTQHDFMVAVIDNRLGDSVGYFGHEIPDPAYKGQNVDFTHMGYPGDFENGERPIRQDWNRILADINWDCGSDGPFYSDTDAMGGQSGGPHWRTGSDGKPYVWGTLSVSISTGNRAWAGWGCGTNMNNLIDFLRNKYP